jgi:hypothetical protein
MIVCRFQGIVRENIVVDGIIKGVPLPVDALVKISGRPVGGNSVAGNPVAGNPVTGNPAAGK